MPKEYTTRQTLLDLRAEVQDPDQVARIDALLALSDEIFAQADERFSRHQYPASDITFNKSAILPHIPSAYFTLSPAARTLLHIMIYGCVRGTLVQIDNSALCRLSQMSLRTVKVAKAELKEAGLITVYRNAYAQEAPIYSVSRAIVATGKHNFVRDDEAHNDTGYFVGPARKRNEDGEEEWVNVFSVSGEGGDDIG